MKEIFSIDIGNVTNKKLKNKDKCKIITVEGIDGSGKTTVINKCIEDLSNRGYKVNYFSSKTTFNNFWNVVKNNVLTQEDACTNDVNQTLHNICFLTYIESFLDELQENNDYLFTDWFFCGKMVLSDLFNKSENSFSKKIITSYLEKNSEFNTFKSYYIDISAKEAFKRIEIRNYEREKKESLEMLEKAKKIWENYVEKYGLIKVDAKLGSEIIAKRIVDDIIK